MHKTKLVQLVPASEHVFGKAVKSHALNARRAAAGGLFGVVTLLRLRAPTLGIVQLLRAAGQRNALIKKGFLMAIGWLTVLKMVPWTDVISNAPKVADGAKKLWGSVGKKQPVASVPPFDAGADLPPETPSVIKMAARLAVLEAASRELHSQMLASSELIATLAEQNTQLIQRVERNRVQLRWLAVVSAVSAVLATAALVVALR